MTTHVKLVGVATNASDFSEHVACHLRPFYFILWIVSHPEHWVTFDMFP